MNQSNVQVIQGFYAALGQGDIETALTYLDPEFVLYQADSLPYGGVYHGYAGVTEFFTLFGQTWQQFQSLEAEYLNAGDYVIVRSRIQGHTKQTNNQVEMPMIQVFQMRHGKAIAAYPFYWDTAKLLQALI